MISEALKTTSHDQQITAPTREKGEVSVSESVQALAGVVEQYEAATSERLDIREDEASYPVLDMMEVEPDHAKAILDVLEQTGEYVWHGMHNNELHREVGNELDWFDEFLPEKSRQQGERAGVYATTSVRGGAVHAVLEHRKQDMNERGETYSLYLGGDGSMVDVSPQLGRAGNEGTAKFTDGWLFAFPADQFEPSGTSAHEVVSKKPVKPVFGIKVASTLGPEVVNTETIKGEDMLDDQKSENQEDEIDELAGQFVDMFSRSNVEVDLEKVKSLFRPGEVYDLEAEHVYDLNFDQIWHRLGIDAKAISHTQKQELLDNGALEMLGKLVEPSLRRDLNRIDLESMINEQNIVVQSGAEGMTAKEVSRTLRSVLADPESKFHQGYNWNVLLSEHSPYALKFIKNNRASYESALDEIENYGTLEDVLGEEFMLPQVVVELGNTRRQVVLQQKLDLDDWQPATAYKGRPPELDKALEDPANHRLLDKFLAGVARLEKEHRLAIDMSGDNVFCRMDENGRLEIKLLDYGCLDVDNPHHQEGVQKSKEFAAELTGHKQK